MLILAYGVALTFDVRVSLHMTTRFQLAYKYEGDKEYMYLSYFYFYTIILLMRNSATSIVLRQSMRAFILFIRVDLLIIARYLKISL